MPRNRFYNRRFASRAPVPDTTSGDCLSSAVGNPPAFDFEARPEHGLSGLMSETSAGPPCGHPASSDFALDGATPASGPSATTRPLGVVESSAAALSADGGLPVKPSDTLYHRPSPATPKRLVPVRLEPFPAPARQCRHVPEPGGAFHRSRLPGYSFEQPSCAPVPAGQRRRAPHGFIEVVKPRLDLSSQPLSRRLRGRVRSCDFCK
jgi:hypothetical protein